MIPAFLSHPSSPCHSAMASGEVFQIQELCDCITDFIDNTLDLRSCALVLPSLTVSAQRRLFHDVVLNEGCWGVYGRTNSRSFDEYGACRRLCSVLKASPQLLRLIRRLRASLESDIVGLLCELDFPNLEGLFFNRRRGGVTKESTLLAAAKLISLSSVRCVGLFYVILRNMSDLRRLFEGCTSPLDSLLLNETKILPYEVGLERALSPPSWRLRISSLQIQLPENLLRSSPRDWEWLIDPLSPFDLTALRDAHYSSLSVLGYASPLLTCSRLTIEKLSMSPQLYFDATNNPPSISLADLPVLRHLTLVGWATLGNVQNVLASLSSSNALEYLEFPVFVGRVSRSAELARLGLALSTANFPLLRHLVIVAIFELGAPSRDHVCMKLRAAFADWDAKGQLEVLV
ncbi:hypothetical protein B0H15DRAFT_1025512 [Mycena belliarum]|uniref:Uncharacterized protein n=1 Tax=Mycena belliarum TaxID=1033014 RepID=A0AAD6TZA7_9AGAR|nr:hypothetical protein B0H15DRAFT_1025512 [Mycena belliae]